MGGVSPDRGTASPQASPAMAQRMSSGGGPRTVLWALALLHVAACLHYFPPREIFSGEPLLTGDYAFRFVDSEHTAARVRAGASYGYSTRAAAGYPTGLAAWLNHKPFMLLLAVTPDAWHALAFNLAVLFALWIPPLLAYATARRFGFDSIASGTAGGLVLFAWYGSTLFRFFWGGGSVLFVDAALLALWAVSAVYDRWKSRAGVPLHAAAAAAAVPWIHPLGCGVLAIGCVALWLASPIHRWRRLLALGILAALVVAANAPWLWIVWRQSHLRGALWYPVYLGGLQSLVFDLVKGPLHLASAYEEAAVLSPLLVAAIAGATRIEPSARRVLVLTAAGLAVAAYFGAALGLRFFQPYRFGIPLAAVLAMVGAPLFVDLLRFRGGALRLALAFGLLVVLADRVRVASRIDAILGAGLSSNETWALTVLRAHEPRGGWKDAGRVLAECELGFDTEPERPGVRRVQYSFAALERYLSAEFLGCPLLQSGTPEEPLSFWLGNLLWRPLESYDAASFGEVLDLYDVGFVLTVRPETRERLRAFAPRLELAAEHGRAGLFRVERRTTRVRQGPGRAWSDGESIFFETDRAEPSVLRYHWVDGLAAEPPAELAPVEERTGTVSSFIEVRPPAAGRYRIALP
jgi:hypothetical protein